MPASTALTPKQPQNKTKTAFLAFYRNQRGATPSHAPHISVWGSGSGVSSNSSLRGQQQQLQQQEPLQLQEERGRGVAELERGVCVDVRVCGCVCGCVFYLGGCVVCVGELLFY